MKAKNCVIVAFLIAFTAVSIAFIQPEEEEEKPMIRASELTQKIETVGNQVIMTYVDGSGAITFATDSGYAQAVTTKTDEWELNAYFDEFGNPALRRLGYYALLTNYDEQGHRIRTTYLGIDGEPVRCLYGYAAISYVSDEKGRVKEEYYFDENMQPACSDSKGFGRRYEYSEKGEASRITNLDTAGNPMITSPARIDCPVITFFLDTVPTIVPVRSDSPAGYNPGSSAVSPPRRAILFSLQALHRPDTICWNTVASNLDVPT